MSIRDIIEAARRISTTAEEATDVGVPGWQDVLDDADTILAHEPELALMEAVCEADDPEPGPIHCQLCGGAGVMSLRDCERCGGSGREPSWQRWKARQDLRDALTAYRKTYGYGD